jgi:hypothetical protein
MINQQRAIRLQDERNRRLRRLRPKQRKSLQTNGLTMFSCPACKREVYIPWGKFGMETPRCRACDGVLRVVTACLNKNVLPKL